MPRRLAVGRRSPQWGDGRESGVVDLNADLGEEVTDDEGLLAVVTSANVACGFHAGTAATMRAVCAGAAAARGVGGCSGVLRRPGALRPGRPRRRVRRAAGPGGRPGRGAGRDRRSGRGSPCATSSRTERCTTGFGVDEDQARAVLAGARPGSPCWGSPTRCCSRWPQPRGAAVWREGFPDRAATADGGLVPRDQPGAVLTDSGADRRARGRAGARRWTRCAFTVTPRVRWRTRTAVRRALEAAGYRLHGL